METLTRLVTESLARHGFDRPVDYRRLQWSRWVRCESHHSLLVVPSKPGVFALAEEIMTANTATADLETHASAVPPREASGGPVPEAETGKPEAESPRMLAVTQFFEDDDMAFVLDRMLSRNHPMRSRLESGHYFVRFVEIKDQTQRRSICQTLNQWVASAAEKATGIGPHFATSLEFTPGTETTHGATAASAAPRRELSGSIPRTASEAHASVSCDGTRNQMQCDEVRATTAPRLNSAVDTTIHCSSSFPAGF